MDPWHDYLAFPIAPLVLVAQAVALFSRRARIRWLVLLGGAIAIAMMFFYVASLPTSASEGVNIGAGVLLLWVVCSVVLIPIGLIVEVVRR